MAKISAYTTDAAPHRTNDFAPTYDASAVATKKVALKDFGAYVLIAECTTFNPADSLNYYMGAWAGLSPTGSNSTRRIYISRAGIITNAYVETLNTGTAGTTEATTVYVRKNDTTDTLLTTITTNVSFNAAGANPTISVAVGDFVEIKLVTPAWATNPTAVAYRVQLFVE
jgi:hypothetical protein